jgi:hypothetical protein
MPAPVFLAAPSSASPAPVPAFSFPGISGMRWEAWDGSVWDLLSRDGVFLSEGVRGLSMPPVTRHTSTAPGLPGSRNRGHRIEEREVFWPVFLHSDVSSQAWIEYDRAFWRTLHPEREGAWVVVHPDGTERRLRLSFVDDGGHSFAADPSRRGWELYGVTLVACRPFWEGAPVVRAWKAAAPVPFFDSLGSPVFRISSGSTVATAEIRNDGDVEAWPVWTITGPTTEPTSVGVAGRKIEVPFLLADGQTLTIDTRPDRQTAIDGTGADRTPDLGAAEFAPVPDGGVASLAISLAGAGSVAASLTPLYFRAW